MSLLGGIHYTDCEYSPQKRNDASQSVLQILGIKRVSKLGISGKCLKVGWDNSGLFLSPYEKCSFIYFVVVVRSYRDIITYFAFFSVKK